jgi:hypothetical protein
MNGAEKKRRQRRPSMTPEELARLIEYRRRLEKIKLARLKDSAGYRIGNVFNILCAFVYLEIIFCFLGPAAYTRHFTSSITPHFGQDPLSQKPVISDVEITASDGEYYTLILNENISLPPVGGSFIIGKDYLLRKELKARFEKGLREYRLLHASPAIFLSILVLIISCVSFFYNLNENAYSLMALTVLNVLNVTGILLL